MNKEIICLTCGAKAQKKHQKNRTKPRYCSRNCTPLGRPKGSKDGGYVTIECQYCHNPFKMPWSQRHRVFCSNQCSANNHSENHISKKVISQCVTCKKDFIHYGSRIACSVECSAKYMSVQRVGEDNPAFKKDKDHSAVCGYCKKTFIYQRGGIAKGYVPKFCDRNCSRKGKKGVSKFGGPVMMPQLYPYKFHQIKEEIKKRDNHTCVLCGKHQNDNGDERTFHVHHVDYDKFNCSSENLVTLCAPCHIQTNFNRFFWQAVFASLLSGSKIVKKGWGFESHITNSADYCLKYLVFFKGKKFSLHYHEIKKELWHCLAGAFNCHLEYEDTTDDFILKAGDKLEINPGLVHQLTALKHSILVEVSTQDFPEDSIRLIKGD